MRKVPARAASSASRSSSWLIPPSGSVPDGDVCGLRVGGPPRKGELIGVSRWCARAGRTAGTITAMDPWTVLGLEPDASPQEVAAAYRELAKRWHPDRRGGGEAVARMAEINVAYDVLRAGDWQRSGPRRRDS